MCRAVKPVQARGRLAQLGEHLPYKQRVLGSSPIGPICDVCHICRSGGTGRRTGLKILRDLYSRTGSIPVCGMNTITENPLKSRVLRYFFVSRGRKGKHWVRMFFTQIFIQKSNMKASKFVELTMILQKFYLTNLSDLQSLKCFLL